jgi:general L-amino acid transport system permease protein
MTSITTIRVPAFQGTRTKLFGSARHAVISLLLLAAIVAIIYPLFQWAIADATWSGTAETCRAGTGACWAFIAEKFNFIIFGPYPREALWQVILATGFVILPAVLSLIPRFWSSRLIWLWIASLTLAVLLMSGTIGTTKVSTQLWGGLPLTLLLSVVGFAAAFPLGTVLAYGRRSSFGIIRLLSISFIEVLRGVPLIAVLYFCTLLFPLMLPGGASVDKLLRTQVAVIFFVSAYIAEIVRAGLEAVPKGQSEAAQALGLNWLQLQRLVVLPQAMPAVIPAFVTLGIGIFLDTTLVTVIGLFDFLNTARAAAADAQWQGFYYEGFAFVAAVYFIISCGLSRYSLWLESFLRPTNQIAKQL